MKTSYLKTKEVESVTRYYSIYPLALESSKSVAQKKTKNEVQTSRRA